MSSDNAGYSAAQLRELLAKDDSDDVIPALEEAGLLTKEEVKLLQSFQTHYEPTSEGYYPQDHPLYERILERAVSQNVRQAVEEGNVSQMQFASGVVNSDNDISGVQLYERLRDFITRTAGVTTIYGHMGSGKTDLALLLAELWQSATGGSVATNILSCKEADEHVEDVDALKEWMAGDADQKLAVLDEFSSHASGYAKDASAVEEKMSSTIKLMRKKGVSLIIIGHTGKDIHPDIRRLARVIYKDSKKSAGVYKSIDNAEPEDEMFSLSGIPQTDWTYDTHEETDWDWCLNDEEGDGTDLKEKRDEWIQQAYRRHDDLSQSDVGDIFDVSAKTVRRALKS